LEAYYGMIKRCSIKSYNRDYKDYAARGVKVADIWAGYGGFEKFLAHIGPRPEKHYSLDRINPTGNYEPGNVRWATTKQQTRNKRNNWLVQVDGEWMNAKDAAKKMKVAYSSLVNACRGAQPFPKGWPMIIFKRRY
jgi:hypothetical protein